MTPAPEELARRQEAREHALTLRDVAGVSGSGMRSELTPIIKFLERIARSKS